MTGMPAETFVPEAATIAAATGVTVERLEQLKGLWFYYAGRYNGLPLDDRSALERYVVTEELLAHGAPVAAHWIADRQVAPALLTYGSEDQRRRGSRRRRISRWRPAARRR